jgi:formate hydrogenlyase subunit 3/multisubunit Na+/H+ antiporter MnhD subunit
MPLVASSSSAFAINGFTGLTGAQQLSFWLTFILFNMYVVLEVISLAAFYFAARPRHGRPNPAAIWYFVAAVLVVFAFITTVWAAPAEKAFLDDTGTQLAVGTKAIKLFIGIAAAALAVLSLLVGMVDTARRRRASSQEVVVL